MFTLNIIYFRKTEKKPYENVDEESTSKTENGSPKNMNGNHEYEMDESYYDDAISAGSTSLSIQGENIPPPRPNQSYAKVCKSNPNLKSHEPPNYDEVYVPEDDRKHRKSYAYGGKPNQYENIVIHNVLGSLKKKLRPWRSSGELTDTVDNHDKASADNDDDSRKKLSTRKPKPAPKPSIRTLKKNLNRGPQNKTKDNIITSDQLHNDANIKRNEIKSELEIIENELYIEHELDEEPMTEL